MWESKHIVPDPLARVLVGKGEGRGISSGERQGGLNGSLDVRSRSPALSDRADPAHNLVDCADSLYGPRRGPAGMDIINPLAGSLAQSTHVQRQQSAEKQRQVRRTQAVQKNVALQDDQL